MVQRMPTPEEQAQLVRALFMSPTASTIPGRLNFIQDFARSANLDLFGPGFSEEAYAAEFAPVTREIYATDPGSPYVSIFSLIDDGIEPVAAANQAIREGVFDPEGFKGDPGSQLEDDVRKDIVDVAKQYAKEMAEYRRGLARARAEAPVSLDEILNPASAFQVVSAQVGKPEGLTTRDVLDLYANRRMAQLRGPNAGAAAAGQPTPAPAPASGGGWGGFVRGISDFAGNIVAPWRQQEVEKRRQPQAAPVVAAPAPPTRQEMERFAPGGMQSNRRLGEAQRGLFESVAKQRLAGLQQQPVWSPQAEQAMRNLAALSLIGGGR